MCKEKLEKELWGKLSKAIFNYMIQLTREEQILIQKALADD